MKHHYGRVEVICGSMFSGKTEELIRRVGRAMIARQKIQVFKPLIDTRYGLESIHSHTGLKVNAHPIQTTADMMNALETDTTVVAIDEVQFFDDSIVNTVEQFAQQGIRVIVAGLDMDFRGVPFGCMPPLLCIAEDVTKLNAICVVCGNPASRTQRLVNGQPAYYDDPVILVGAQEAYEARCREHHVVPHR